MMKISWLHKTRNFVDCQLKAGGIASTFHVTCVEPEINVRMVRLRMVLFAEFQVEIRDMNPE